MQSQRARRVSISVRVSGEVRLTFPVGVPPRRALAFLEEKCNWILTSRERMARKRAALPPQLPSGEQRERIEALRRAAKADLPERIARLGGDGPPLYETLDPRLAHEVGGVARAGTISR